MPIQSAELNVTFAAYEKGTNTISAQVFAPKLQKVLQFANGTLSDQADIVWAAERTIAAAGNDDLDLAGVLSTAFGTPVAAAEIVGVVIMSNAANPAALNVGGGSNPWITMWLATGDGIKVFPGGVFCNFARDASGLGAVTPGTGDILRINNPGGASATYQIAILARSA